MWSGILRGTWLKIIESTARPGTLRGESIAPDGKKESDGCFFDMSKLCRLTGGKGSWSQCGENEAFEMTKPRTGRESTRQGRGRSRTRVSDGDAHAEYEQLGGQDSCSVYYHVRCLMCCHFLRGGEVNTVTEKSHVLNYEQGYLPGLLARSMGRPVVFLMLHRTEQ